MERLNRILSAINGAPEELVEVLTVEATQNRTAEPLVKDRTYRVAARTADVSYALGGATVEAVVNDTWVFAGAWDYITPPEDGLYLSVISTDGETEGSFQIVLQSDISF